MDTWVNWSYFDLDWSKLDMVRPRFGFVDNYLGKTWRFNQLGNFFTRFGLKNMDKFSQVRTFFTYITLQESGSTSSLISIANRVFTMAEWIRGKQFHKVSSICRLFTG